MAANKISEIVFFHRQKAGLSRKDLAKLAGVGKTSIYDLEKGKDSLRMNTVESILKALNIKIIYSSPLMEYYEKSTSKDT